MNIAHHELHEDGGHADTVPGTDTLEHVLALGGLGPVLLPDGSELLQHLELGLPQVGLHVGVPVMITSSISDRLAMNVKIATGIEATTANLAILLISQ